ncbi:hypothetical protein GCM10027284_09510 [Cyclobacterium sediminis]
MNFKHPITHTEDIRTVAEIASGVAEYNQYYILPDNCENDDNVGKVNFLWSHQKFYNRKFGTSIMDGSYTFTIVGGNGDGAFSIGHNSGELYIDNASLFTSSRLLTVRVKLFESYYQDTICKIDRIAATDCVFFDSGVSGNSGSGTKADPYSGWSAHFYGGDLIEWGTAGKYYLWKRGQTFEDWTKIRNPLVEGVRPDYITLGAYGKGDRPKINGSNNATSERFCDVSDSRLNGTSYTATSNPEMVAYNVRIMDIETTFDGNGSWYPYQVGMYGKGLRFHRLKSSMVTVWEDGFFWVKNNPGSVGAGNIEALFQDIETYDSKYRGIKFESGGIMGRNFRCYTSLSDTETPLSPANAPYVDLKYIDQQVSDNQRGLGMQIRATQHVIQWAYLKGYRDAMNPFRHEAHNGLDDSYRLKNSGFKHILIDGCTRNIGQFVSNGGDKVPRDNFFSHIDVINSENVSFGLHIHEDAENTLIEMCNLGNTPGIVVFGDASGTQIRNCTIPGVIDRRSPVTIINSVYGNLVGVGGGFVISSISPLQEAFFKNMQAKDYRPAEGSVLIGAGTDIDLEFDLDGNDVPGAPSIGAYEYIETDPDPDPDPNPIPDPEPVPGKVFYRGIRFVTLSDRYGEAIFNAYKRVKITDAKMGARLADVKPIVDKILAFGWDMLNVPFANKGNQLYSLIGPDLTVTGGGGGSRFDWDRLLQTQLPDNQPRFTFNPDTGIFEGVFLEVESTNEIDVSQGDVQVPSPWGNLNCFEMNNSYAIQELTFHGKHTVSALFKRADGAGINFSESTSGSGAYDVVFFINGLPGNGAGAYNQIEFFERKEIGQGWVQVNVITEHNPSFSNSAFYIRNSSGNPVYVSLVDDKRGDYLTSYINTTGSPVTRPADQYTMPGLIDTSGPYSLFEIRNRSCILKYVIPASGVMKTYQDGVYMGEESISPTEDYEILSEGSDKVLAFGYYSGVLTESDRLHRSNLMD